jgi:hypothetical protein
MDNHFGQRLRHAFGLFVRAAPLGLAGSQAASDPGLRTARFTRRPPPWAGLGMSLRDGPWAGFGMSLRDGPWAGFGGVPSGRALGWLWGCPFGTGPGLALGVSLRDAPWAGFGGVPSGRALGWLRGVPSGRALGWLWGCPFGTGPGLALGVSLRDGPQKRRRESLFSPAPRRGVLETETSDRLFFRLVAKTENSRGW